MTKEKQRFNWLLKIIILKLLTYSNTITQKTLNIYTPIENKTLDETNNIRIRFEYLRYINTFKRTKTIEFFGISHFLRIA